MCMQMRTINIRLLQLYSAYVRKIKRTALNSKHDRHLDWRRATDVPATIP